MKRLLPLLLLLPVLCFGQGDQTIIKVPIDNAGNTENAILHLPDDYSTATSTSYPILVFLHGVGEGSLTDPSTIYNSSDAGGPAYIIAHGGWPSSFVNPKDSKSYKFIVVSPQAAYGTSTTSTALETILTYLLKTYRVDQSRVYLTGISAGGEGVLEYVGGITAAGANVGGTHKIAAFVPMSAVMNAYFRGQYADTIVKNNVQLWGFGSATDVHGANTLNLVVDVNNIKAGYALSTAYSGGHCCWEQFYQPSYTLNSMNIYQWMLQYTQGTSTSGSAASSSSSSATTYTAVPGTVQAEAYTSMSGVGIETTADATGSQDVGWIDSGDWMTYSLNVATAGTYTASFRVASPYAGASFQVLNASGSVLATVSVPNTGAFQTWQTITANLTLPAGNQALTIKSTGTGWNFNYMTFATATTYYAVPGTVEAENYSAMSGVQTETTSDATGSKDVGWIDAGDYMDYQINVATAGTYSIGWRVASPLTGVSFQLLNAAGAVLSTVNVPNTGGYQVWQTVTTLATLPAGTQTVRVKASVTGWNLNYMTFAAATAFPSSYAIPGVVEAEGYSSMSGVALENTLDAGGGYDVGWIDNGDWMKYTVNVATAGSYTVSFRVAAKVAGQLQLQNASGTALATVTVPATGGYQTWQSVTATVTLAAGSQTLILKSTAAGNWNINNMTFTSVASTSSSTVSTPAIPGTIYAANYVLMTGVGTETTSDAGGGTDVGWIDDGDWMNYTVNVAKAGIYSVTFRIATPNNLASLQLLSNGYAIANVLLPNTGGYQVWQNYTTTVNLNAGVQTLQVKSTSTVGWNFHYMSFVSATSSSRTANGVMSAATAGSVSDDATTELGTESLTIYPNPAKDHFTIRMNNEQSGSMRVTLLDVAGAIRQTQEYTKAAGVMQVTVNTSTLAPGVYFVRMQVGTLVTTKKIVKQ